MKSGNAVFVAVITTVLSCGFAVLVIAKIRSGPPDAAVADVPMVANLAAPPSINLADKGTVTAIQDAIDEGQFQDASDMLGSVQTQDTSEYWYLSGYLEQAEEHFSVAVDDYRKAVRLDPKNSELHFRLGLALYKDSKFDEAIESFRICVTLDPKNIDAWKCAARVFVAEKQYQRAIDVVHKSIPLKPDDAAWYGILGTCFVNLKQYGNANDAYRVYASLKPDVRRFAVEEISSPSDLDEDNDRRDGPAMHGREGERDNHRPRAEDGKRDDRGRGDEKERRLPLEDQTDRALSVGPSPDQQADSVNSSAGQDAAGKPAGRGR